MGAVFKRELKTYFHSPLGYIFLAIMFCFSAYAFVYMLSANVAMIQIVFSYMLSIVSMVIPLLTMRLMSEDKKLKTDQLLLTASVNISGVVMGKYLAAFVMFLIGMLPMILYVLILAGFTMPDWNIFLGNFLALALLGGSMIAIGLLISSLTESQVVSAIVTFVVMMLITMLDSIAMQVPAGLGFVAQILTSISFMSRYDNLCAGLLDFSYIFFFLSVMVIFVFLTIRVLEKKRWS